METANAGNERGVRSVVRVSLLVLLVASAAAALLLQPRIIVAVRSGGLTPEWLLVTPGIFSLVVFASAVETALGARRRGYLSGRALLQLGFVVAFVAFLLPRAWSEYRARKAPPVASAQLLESLAKSRDARVRAVVMDLAGFRGQTGDVAEVLERGLNDRDPMVRATARGSVSRRANELLEEADHERALELARSWRRVGSNVEMEATR
jgi:hypothetical protein